MSITEIYEQTIEPLSPDSRLQQNAPESHSMADLSTGRTGTAAGGGQAFSENGGYRSAKHLAHRLRSLSR